MWLSKCNKEMKTGGNFSDLGEVTIGGNPVGVYSNGERRNLPVYAPYGFWWKPKAGQNVLVIKTGAGEQSCVAGAKQGEPPVELAQGEVLMGNESAWVMVADDKVRLNGATHVGGDFTVNGNTSMNGTVSFGGEVYVGGVTLNSMIKSIVSSMM